MIPVVKSEVASAYWSRAFRSPPDILVIHRFGPEIKGKDMVFDQQIVEWFKRAEAGTGRRFPYHFLVRTKYNPSSVSIRQMLPLDVCGVAQRHWNSRSLCLAVVGDWRRQAILDPALHALGDFCATLREQHNLKYLAGHSDLPEGSKWPNHTCPGLGIDLRKLRDLSGLQDIPEEWYGT
jgi:hypothetical protein